MLGHDESSRVVRAACLWEVSQIVGTEFILVVERGAKPPEQHATASSSAVG